MWIYAKLQFYLHLLYVTISNNLLAIYFPLQINSQSGNPSGSMFYINNSKGIISRNLFYGYSLSKQVFKVQECSKNIVYNNKK
jgi:hypothetical protein